MGEIVGFVTRSRGAPGQALFGVTSGTADISRNQFVATKADRTSIGSYPTMHEARSAVRRSTGNKLLNWQRIDLESRIEHWEARSSSFYPGDLGDLLRDGAWWRADQGVPNPTPATDAVPQWFSNNGAQPPDLVVASQSIVGSQPTLVEVGPNGQSSMGFDAGGGDSMSTNLTIGGDAGMTVVAAVYPIAPGHGGDRIVMQTPTYNMFIDTGSGGVWSVDVDPGPAIVGPAAVMDKPVIVSSITRTGPSAGTEAFIDGGSIGSNALVTLAGALTISEPAESWTGGILEMVLLRVALGVPRHDAIVQYMKSRYNID